MAYKLEIINDNDEITEEIFEKQIDIVKKYGIGDRSLRKSITSNKFRRGKDYVYRCSYVLNDNEILQGKSERLPTLVKEDDTYFITYGKDKLVSITEDELSKMRKLYCNKHGMTIEQLGLEMNFLREEIIAIKTAFNFVKSSIPYTDKEIDEMTVEEMAEDSRIHKKKAYFRKLEDLKTKDMEQELKKLHHKDYYYNKIIERMASINLKPVNINKNIESFKTTLIVSLSDLHVGASFKNITGKYNIDVFKKRMKILTDKVVDGILTHKPERVIIQNLGDSINGIKNMANRIESDCGLIDSIQIAVEEIANLLMSISEISPRVEYYNVFANHSEIFKDKILNIEEENFERLITWGLQGLLKYYDNIEINTANDVVKYDLYNEITCLHHGHNNLDIGKFTYKYGKYPRLIFKGHYHSFKIDTKGSAEEVQVGTMMGSDSYANSKGFISTPSQLITLVNDKFDIAYIPIYFKED